MRAHNRIIKTVVFSWYRARIFAGAVFLRKSFHLSSRKHVRGSIMLDTEVHPQIDYARTYLDLKIIDDDVML
jgi:hypothetical protein